MSAPTIESLSATVTSLRSDIKSLSKLVRKLVQKQEDPDGEKAKARSANNGFNRPQVITKELQEFLGLEEGEMISRSNVTKLVNKYVTENGLKHPDNGRILILDDKMNELLKPPADLQITFLNIQKFLSPHYIKTGPAVTEAATTMVSMAATKDVKIEPEVTSAPEVVKKKRPVVRKPKAAAAADATLRLPGATKIM